MKNVIVSLDMYPKNGEHQEYLHPFSHFFKIVKGKDGFRFPKKWYVYDTEFAPDDLNLFEYQKTRCFNTPENAYRYLLREYRKYLGKELKKCETEIERNSNTNG